MMLMRRNLRIIKFRDEKGIRNRIACNEEYAQSTKLTRAEARKYEWFSYKWHLR